MTGESLQNLKMVIEHNVIRSIHTDIAVFTLVSCTWVPMFWLGMGPLGIPEPNLMNGHSKWFRFSWFGPCLGSKTMES